MAAADQAGILQPQRRGSYREQSGGYVNEKGFGRSLSQGRYYSPQAHSAFYTQQRSSFRQQAVGVEEFVEEDLHAERRKSRGGKYAGFLGLSWFFAWPCYSPCCSSL
ncbi:unnamed protein product [Calypogeia fissa]